MPSDFQRETTIVDVLLNEMLSISLFHQCALQMRHVSVEMTSYSQPTPVGGRESSLCSPF
jgi:hypothetical protein